MKKLIALMMALLMFFAAASFAENAAADGTAEVESEGTETAEVPYTLEQVVILSRHNLRAPPCPATAPFQMN